MHKHTRKKENFKCLNKNNVKSGYLRLPIKYHNVRVFNPLINTKTIKIVSFVKRGISIYLDSSQSQVIIQSKSELNKKYVLKIAKLQIAASINYTQKYKNIFFLSL